MVSGLCPSLWVAAALSLSCVEGGFHDKNYKNQIREQEEVLMRRSETRVSGDIHDVEDYYFKGGGKTTSTAVSHSASTFADTSSGHIPAPTSPLHTSLARDSDKTEQRNVSKSSHKVPSGFSQLITHVNRSVEHLIPYSFGQSMHQMTSVQVLTAILRRPGVKQNNYAANFGAGNGKCSIRGRPCDSSATDPCYPMFHDMGYAGLAIERDLTLLPALAVNLPSAKVSKMNAIASPFNSVELLREADAPMDMDYLHVNIDGSDCAIVYAILQGGYRPKVVQVQVNPGIPYPVIFGLNYGSNMTNAGSRGFYGCSLTLVARLMQFFGYEPVAVSLPHDVIFTKKEYVVPGSSLLALEVEEAQVEETHCCLSEPLLPTITLARLMELDAHSKHPEFIVDALRPLIEQACGASSSSRQTWGCAVPYTLGLDVSEFIDQYECTWGTSAAHGGCDQRILKARRRHNRVVELLLFSFCAAMLLTAVLCGVWSGKLQLRMKGVS